MSIFHQDDQLAEIKQTLHNHICEINNLNKKIYQMELKFNDLAALGKNDPDYSKKQPKKPKKPKNTFKSFTFTVSGMNQISNYQFRYHDDISLYKMEYEETIRIYANNDHQAFVSKKDYPKLSKILSKYKNYKIYFQKNKEDYAILEIEYYH
jgi:hypothetical protein